MDFEVIEQFKNLIPPLTQEEFSQLEDNIFNDGIRDALVIGEYSEEGKTKRVLIDGHNRLEIAKAGMYEYKTKTIKFDSVWAVQEWMILHQFGRRNLNKYQCSILALKLEDSYAEKAKAKQGVRSDLDVNFPHNCAESPEDLPTKKETNETRHKLAKLANVSHGTISRVKKLEEKATPEIKEQLQSGEMSINQAYKEVRKVEKKVEQEVLKIELSKRPIPKTLKSFDLIYIDPPWRYDFSKSISRDIENQYPTMSLEEMKALDIPANDNCVMYMWATAPKLLDALELLNHWGFCYKTNAVWDKEKIGMGYWFRGQHEILLVGTKGKFSPPEASTRSSSVIKGKRGKHSKKPFSVYQQLNEWFPFASKIEMFARNEVEGFYSWGNQV